MSWWSRLGHVIFPSRLDRDLEEEQQFHLEARVDDLVASGMSRRAAIEQASRQFGNRLLLRESSRDVKLLPHLESLWRDFRLGVRLLRKDAVVASAAILSLALAIGACAAAFSLIDALILRQLPVRQPASLVCLTHAGDADDLRLSMLFSYPALDRLRESASAYMDVFSVSHQSLRQAILPDASGVEEKLRTQFVSGNVFEVLGVRPAIGRIFTSSDDITPGGHPVAVISHAFWTRRLGGSPAAIGEWIRLEQRPYEIVGVAQAGFTGVQPGAPTDVWLPNMMFQAESLRNPGSNWLQIWGRLHADVSRETVRPIVQTALANFAADRPDAKGPERQAQLEAFDVRDASSGVSQVRENFQRPLLTLAAIVCVVLLIACSNVANLLLARGAARRREMALRASIGAGRGRLMQQVLVESSVLTAAATALSVLFARASIPLIVGMLTTNENPVNLETSLDWRVLTFVALLGCLTTVLFGLAPAVRASSTPPGETTALGDRHHTASAGMARPLLAAQIAFSLMILFVAALLLRSFDRLLRVDLGFKPEGLVLVTVEARDRFDPARAREIGRQLLERVRAMNGVESASMSSWALFRGWSSSSLVGIPGRGRAQSFRLALSPQFFRTMGTPILDGRELEPRDNDGADPVPVIVNASYARKYFAGEAVIGRRLFTTSRGRPVSYEIVGVVGDVRDGSVREATSPFLFTPIAEPDGTIQVRTRLDARVIADRVREELTLVHPSLRLVDVTTQSALVGNTLLRERLLATLSGFFAVLGLVLAAVGLYGVSSYVVVRRTREIGIRLTLGARPAAVVRSILGGMALATGAGIIAGLMAGMYLARFVRTLLYEVEPVSAWSVGVPVLCLAMVVLAAAWSPARRAVRIDPAEALRLE